VAVSGAIALIIPAVDRLSQQTDVLVIARDL
jgi:hypothetical protein